IDNWEEGRYTPFVTRNQVATVTNGVYSPLFFSLSLFLKVFFWGKNARGIFLVSLKILLVISDKKYNL
ncbi:hypothetical protein, partial [Peptacetobacter sp.]|uniref:hypothetical protein n=1 Tax=Peptacetobacter sp. TaxID=2991975 RepID=UPI002637EB31